MAISELPELPENVKKVVNLAFFKENFFFDISMSATFVVFQTSPWMMMPIILLNCLCSANNLMG